MNRKFAPASDGLLLPLAALLNGIGYVFIARLDQDLAAAQATWTAIGIGLYIATLVVIRDYRWLAKYPYTWALIGVALLVVPLLPGIGRNINGSRIWVDIGPISFQPGEFAEDRPRHLLRRVPGTAARAAQRGHVPDRSAEHAGPEALRSDPHGVGRLAGRDDLREGPRLGVVVLRAVRRDALGRDRSRRVPGGRRGFCSGSAPCSPGRSSNTSSAVWTSGSTRGPIPRAAVSRSSSRSTRWRGAARPAPVPVSASRGGSPTTRRTSSSPSSVRNWAWSGPRRSSVPSC